MSSSRLPGKMLKHINGKPVLTYVIERLQHCKNNKSLIVATSIDETDNDIQQLCDSLRIPCFRGSLNNVVERFSSLVASKNIDSFVRISGDSPMIDYKLVDYAISLFNQNQCDIVTNLFPRSYPKGQSIEVLRSGVFNSAIPDITLDDDKEHLSTFFYRHPDRFNIMNFTMDPVSSHIQLSIDTMKDFTDLTAIISSMDKSHYLYGLNEIMFLKESLSETI